MRLDPFQDLMLDAMGNYLTRLSARQQIVASNLSNIDTPGYKTKDISFHATMEQLLSQHSITLRVSRPEHNALANRAFAPPELEAFEVRGLPMRADNNNVDIDREMLRLGETSFSYSMIGQLLRGKFRTLASAINEGRG